MTLRYPEYIAARLRSIQGSNDDLMTKTGMKDKDLSSHCETQLAKQPGAHRRLFRPRVVVIEIVIGLTIAFGYVAYERIGTIANVDLIEFTRNVTGGFLAIGMTDDQPGFIVISGRDREETEVRAELVNNRIAGDHTVVTLSAGSNLWRHRLRGPAVVIVGEDGAVCAKSVDWSREEFVEIQEAVDCEVVEGKSRVRCGRPFADLAELFSTWKPGRVPGGVRMFLEPFADTRAVRANYARSAKAE